MKFLLKYSLLSLILTISNSSIAANKNLSKLDLPDGFSIKIYSSDIKSPRQMAESDGGVARVSAEVREVSRFLLELWL